MRRQLKPSKLRTRRRSTTRRRETDRRRHKRLHPPRSQPRSSRTANRCSEAKRHKRPLKTGACSTTQHRRTPPRRRLPRKLRWSLSRNSPTRQRALMPIDRRQERRERGSKTMTIETMAREFRYDGVRLPDPNPKLSVEEVRTAFSATYPEIATAAVTGPEAVGNKLVYHFAKAIGTKG